ncbi:MAG TPA: DinB family protein [Anaerolineales bacterium]
MPIALLLDLDDTLLESNLAEFLPSYYEALGRHLASVAPPQAMLDALRSGVQQMMLNLDPSRSLQEVFDAEFYPRLGADASKLRERIMDFYREEFPKLRSRTRPKDGARELVDWALSAGHEVGLATDPLFPMIATAERVRWAGLDPEQFAIISSYETFHFTKSHPDYYAEVLGRMGSPDRPVLMAGNDVERDLQPAARLGLTTFHVTSAGNGADGAAGDLGALREWIEYHEADMQAPPFNTRETITTVLRSTPAVLRGMTLGLTQTEWTHEPSPEEWAVIELVCHLRDTEREVHLQQIDTMLESDDPFVARPDAAYWAKQRRYLAENGPAAVREFTAARLVSLDRLQNLPDEVWAKGARHAIFGPTNFLEVICFMAEHDRIHVRQAWRTLHPEAELPHRK